MKISKWAILISGTGSNLQAVLDLVSDIKPTIVISNNAKAPGLGKARRMGIATKVLISPIDWKTLDQDLKNSGIQKIFLLGFMKIVPESFIQKWENKILNLHPSLLPSYPGLKAFERAFADQKPLGATVHFVVPEVDAGPLLLQKKIATQNSKDLQDCRYRLSWTEQSLVREVFLNESF